MPPGRVVLLIGTSSAGKTTTSAALQNRFDTHHMAVGFDIFLSMVDWRWAGHGPYTEEGFRYDKSTIDESGAVISTISVGPIGRDVLHGTHRAVAALASSGNNVIVDEILLDSEVLDDWRAALRGLQVFVVQVRASPESLDEREQYREQYRGIARGHLAMNTLSSYDVAVNTSDNTPEECANLIAAAFLKAGNKPINTIFALE